MRAAFTLAFSLALPLAFTIGFSGAASGNTYNDLLFLNQMNDAYCTGNGGQFNGISCSNGGSSGRVISVEEQERLRRENAAFTQTSAALKQAASRPIDAGRFARSAPAVDLPVETPMTAPLFTCLRQRIAGLLMSERADATYARMINLSGYSFHASVNVRDIYYWTQDILALASGQDRFLLDLDKPQHRQVMSGLILREAPRAWADLQAAVSTHDPAAVLASDASAKASWFLADVGLVYAYLEEDPQIKLGRSFYFPASCRNHWNGTRAKLIPVTGYYMDAQIEAFTGNPAGTRLEGILPSTAP